MTSVPKPTPLFKEPRRLKSVPHRIPEVVRRKALILWGATCRWCGQEGGAVDLHHVKRRSQGGKDEWENLRPVHRKCHGYIHEHPAEAKRRGFLA